MEAPPAERVMIAEKAELVATPAQRPETQAIASTFTEGFTSPSPEVAAEPSLGSSLIASGIVRKRPPLASDPLAPIRRMSQAEKIALFS